MTGITLALSILTIIISLLFVIYKLDIIKHFKKITWGLNILSIILMVVSFVYAIKSIYETNYDKQDKTYYPNNQIVELNILTKKIINERDSLLKITRKINKVGFVKDTLSISNRLNEIEVKLDSQIETTTALKQAINPINPDEILKISRLIDEIKSINSRITSIENNLNNKQNHFEESIKRELSNNANSTALLITVLIPLILNFIYNIWKDSKKEL